ncbi:protein Shroom2 isoform X2 [Antennarius striatus]
MENLERPSHPFPPGRLSPNKYVSGAELLCRPGSRRDSGLSCLSSGASPPVHDASAGRRGTSAENIFFKGLQSEAPQQAEWPRYLQPTLGSGGSEGQPTSRVSLAGRAGIAPVWQAPEKKKSLSPPPPLAPLRSESFTATKVFPYPEGQSGSKVKGRSHEHLVENKDQNSLNTQEKTTETRHSFNPLPNKAADHNQNRLHPNKLFSLSSIDVRQSHHMQTPDHQRQYSDESPLYLHTSSAPPTHIQSVGSYYRSLQDLPINVFGRKQVRHSTASIWSSTANPIQENRGKSRSYCLNSSVETTELQARHGKSDGWRKETEKPHRNEPGLQSSLKTNMKAKYSLPQFHMPYGDNKEHNGQPHQGHDSHYNHQTSELGVQTCSPEDPAKRRDGLSNNIKRGFPMHQNTDHKFSFSRHQDPWVPQEDHRISPLKTPLLHSLANESKALAERKSAALTTPVIAVQDVGNGVAASGGKLNRRSDRYATTLRNEIQQKRAQLQKSRSAATLTCDPVDEETEEWRSTKAPASSFSNTYKDHLKEAQARVLQATSFQRRDLEPLVPEAPVVKTSNGRVRGRKRLPLVKKMHSFSEPDKIDQVGVEGESQTGSLVERRKFFEAKPAFSRPVLNTNQGTNLNADLGDACNTKERTPAGEPEEPPLSSDSNLLLPGHNEVSLEQQRLGTFAEYQATWSKQKKSTEARTQGRYHSAENILDADPEKKAVCFHERSRSSPSADFYTQNVPSPWSDPHSQQSSATNREKSESRLLYQSDHSPQSAPSVPRNEGPAPGLTDHRSKPDTASPSHNTQSLGPRSLSPNPGSQYPAQLPEAQSLLPQPKSHFSTETTSSSSSSSQEFLFGAPAAQPLSGSGSDTHAVAQNSSAGPSSSPHLNSMSGADVSRGGAGNEEEKEHTGASSPQTLNLQADRGRSPSPQFSPLRLTDKPPAVFVQDESPVGSENGLKPPAEMEVSSPVRKVPVRIVHIERNLEAEDGASPCCEIYSIPSPVNGHAVQDQGSVPELNSVRALHTEEDAKREELARDIMGKDKSLVDILDQTGRMTTMDLMEGLFATEEQILEGALQRKRASSISRLPSSSIRTTDRREEEDVSLSAAASLVPSSSYYNTSAPKAELLIKMKDMQEQLEEQDSEDELDIDLASKKQELISSLAEKLQVLREARHSLQEDMEDNEALGREVEATVQRRCQPNQLDKFRMFVGDLDKVVSLLLSLSGRLARVENALNSLEEEAPPEEKRTLTEKRKLLMRQHEDAKELKENLDRRERLVSIIMEAHLDAESLDDYRHFVKMKSALIIEQRKLEDKIKLGEEQLKCLVDSLPLDQRPLL